MIHSLGPVAACRWQPPDASMGPTDTTRSTILGHKTYISFKAEDSSFKDEIQSWTHLDYVDKSLNTPINSTDPDDPAEDP